MLTHLRSSTAGAAARRGGPHMPGSHALSAAAAGWELYRLTPFTAMMMKVPDRRWKLRRAAGRFRPARGGWRAARSGDQDDVRRESHHALRSAAAAHLDGGLFLAHGALLKLGTFGLAGTMGFFGSIGYPPVYGAVVAFAEILGGLALIAGVGVRLVSLLFLPIMIGATVQHLGNGWVFTAQGGGWEFPAFWTVTLLVQAGLGAGAHALDPARLLGMRRTAAA